jgi:hypothetical protein
MTTHDEYELPGRDGRVRGMAKSTVVGQRGGQETRDNRHSLGHEVTDDPGDTIEAVPGEVSDGLFPQRPPQGCHEPESRSARMSQHPACAQGKALRRSRHGRFETAQDDPVREAASKVVARRGGLPRQCRSLIRCD